MTYTNDDDLWPYAKSIRPEGYTYIVSWGSGPNAIVKVGSTWAPKRWRGYLSRGGSVELIVRSTRDVRLEAEVHESMRLLAPMAFHCKEQAEPYLGSRGAGWTECYLVSPDVALREMEWVMSSG